MTGVSFIPLSEAFRHRVENEVNRTHKRVTEGELPANLLELSPSQRLAVLVEEIGELAELAKTAEGRKPKKHRQLEIECTEGESVQLHIASKVQMELVQVAAIAADWYMAISEKAIQTGAQ